MTYLSTDDWKEIGWINKQASDYYASQERDEHLAECADEIMGEPEFDPHTKENISELMACMTDEQVGALAAMLRLELYQDAGVYLHQLAANFWRKEAEEEALRRLNALNQRDDNIPPDWAQEREYA